MLARGEDVWLWWRVDSFGEGVASGWTAGELCSGGGRQSSFLDLFPPAALSDEWHSAVLCEEESGWCSQCLSPPLLVSVSCAEDCVALWLRFAGADLREDAILETLATIFMASANF
jgi:hypothetical protein